MGNLHMIEEGREVGLAAREGERGQARTLLVSRMEGDCGLDRRSPAEFWDVFEKLPTQNSKNLFTVAFSSLCET